MTTNRQGSSVSTSTPVRLLIAAAVGCVVVTLHPVGAFLGVVFLVMFHYHSTEG